MQIIIELLFIIELFWRPLFSIIHVTGIELIFIIILRLSGI